MIEEVPFQGYTCVRIVNGDGAELLVTVDRGPRIIAFQEPSESNLLAVLPGAGLDSPRGRFHFYGGHRLWVAPEDPKVTYLPDEEPCTVESHPRWLKVTAPDNGCGLERSMDITGNGDTFVIDHRITNVIGKPIEAAPWGITQFPVGGVAMVPLPSPKMRERKQASHALVLWPYSDITDPRLTLAREHLLIRGTDESAPFKVGVNPGTPRIGYWRNRRLFIKEASLLEGDVPDLGAASQVYTGSGFLELETLGPLSRLGPGDSTGHRERWTSHHTDSLDDAVDAVVGLA